MIITNNPLVAEQQGCPLVKGNPLDVLVQVDALLDQGYFLATAPLSANNRLNRSPYRSVILSREKNWTGDDKALLAKAIMHLTEQGTLTEDLVGQSKGDYQIIDAEHVAVALSELEKL